MKGMKKTVLKPAFVFQSEQDNWNCHYSRQKNAEKDSGQGYSHENFHSWLSKQPE